VEEGTMHDQLVTRILPILAKRSEDEFNIFNVMHHGTHEKQFSNVFAWLLDANGTHKLGDAFQQMFVDEINGGLGDQHIPPGKYRVQQEVNTSDAKEPPDIADLVLEGNTGTVLVVENYYISSGHGHSYKGYRKYGDDLGRSIDVNEGKGVVVMLCELVNKDELEGSGWGEAVVVTYANLVKRLVNHVESDEGYKRANHSQCTFFQHMHSRFGEGRRMGDDDLSEFINAMCASGEARRFGFRPIDKAGSDFGDDLKKQAESRFIESREFLQRVKSRLKNYGPHLIAQANKELGRERFSAVSANYAGIYEWSVNFTIAGEEAEAEAVLQLKFGPSAWYANEKDNKWKTTVSAGDADYSRLFLTRWKTKKVRQSAVTLQEVLDGLSPDDFRLRDEIVHLVRESS